MTVICREVRTIPAGLGTAIDDFIQMYSDVVMEVGKKYFEELIDKMKEKNAA